MANSDQNCYRLVCFIVSVVLNIFLIANLCISRKPLSWSSRAAAEAEAVASISCSGHGRAFLDGLIENGKPVCECNACYGGPDCSQLLPNCVADADSGDPLFLEPFWMKNSGRSTVVIPGWHRMSYDYSDNSYISQELEKNIRKLHAITKNAVTDGRYIVFGAGSTQLLNAAVYALSMNMSSPAKVVAEKPFYPFEFHGDASLLRNGTSKTIENVIEFVASPNNPDGNLKKAVLEGPSVKTIHDYAYYWPHYTAIPAPADEDIMIFTMSKLTGHAGSRFGWAIVKDKDVYENMLKYKSLADSGTSKDTQLRALKLIKRFKLQEIPLPSAIILEQLEEHLQEEDSNCHKVLHHEANILGREGRSFNAEDIYVRLSLVKSADDFNLLLERLKELVSKEEQNQTIRSS
ncbi:UNVERIFIED_CONTAM: Tryptophan aminotransferase-related protein 4 [Sesamum latifolium]|uniref:Tryptophan aminotransferase-related protein 4 n=1 Tax=Sesamum latifolium TaxID=2727402 RepID=A0AAW2WJI9_9LAMI